MLYCTHIVMSVDAHQADALDKTHTVLLSFTLPSLAPEGLWQLVPLARQLQEPDLRQRLFAGTCRSLPAVSVATVVASGCGCGCNSCGCCGCGCSCDCGCGCGCVTAAGAVLIPLGHSECLPAPAQQVVAKVKRWKPLEAILLRAAWPRL